MQASKNKYWIVNKLEDKRAEILLYGYIGPYDINANDFIRELKNLEKDNDVIDLRINSGGGSVFEGIAIYNALKASTATINVYIDGLAASMASVIAMAGSMVMISKNAMMMTHLPSTSTYGNSKDHKKNAQLLESIEKTMINIYSERTGMEAQDVKEMFLNGEDAWFNADEAIDMGLADGTYDLEPVRELAAARDERGVYDHYAKYLEIKNERKMNKIEITPEVLAMAPADADQASFESWLAKLTEAARELDNVRSEKEALQNEKNEVEAAFAAYKEAEEASKTEALLEAAVKDGRMSVNQKVKLAAKYKGDYDGLKELVSCMPKQVLVTDAIANSEEAKKIELLKQKSGKELFRDGDFDYLKAMAPDVFTAKYKEFTGADYEM